MEVATTLKHTSNAFDAATYTEGSLMLTVASSSAPVAIALNDCTGCSLNMLLLVVLACILP